MELFEYQIEGVKALAGKKRFLLRSDPGLGKTAQLITAAKVINAQSILVICPKTMCLPWEREIVKWGGDLSKFTIINHDKLITKAFRDINKAWDLIICDENHIYLKNIDTKRAKAFFELMSKAERVWLATATLASKSGEDYYCPLKILLPEMMQKTSKTKFLSRYCKKIRDPFSPWGYRYDGFANMDELNKIFSVCSLRHKEDEVKLQLPELTETDWEIDGKYESFSKEEVSEIKQALIEGSGFGADYQGRMKASAMHKIPAVLDLLNSYPADKKVVIFAWHRDVVNSLVAEIAKHCERNVAKLTGEITDNEARQLIIDNFQTGACNTLVLNIQSGGAGITLTAATVGIYIQFPHSVIHWVQSRKRVHRIGSKKPVQLIKLISRGSIDEEIFAVLSERAKMIKEVEG